jgi:hypothetical protein
MGEDEETRRALSASIARPLDPASPTREVASSNYGRCRVPGVSIGRRGRRTRNCIKWVRDRAIFRALFTRGRPSTYGRSGATFALVSIVLPCPAHAFRSRIRVWVASIDNSATRLGQQCRLNINYFHCENYDLATCSRMESCATSESLDKKEAARKRPKSREETPKEGMR